MEISGDSAVTLVWIVLGTVFIAPVALSVRVTYSIIRARILYIPMVVRIFLESPLFMVPKAQPDAQAEDLQITTGDGLKLAACWIPPRAPLKGVILFGIEFGSNRWSCLHYCQSLLDAGYAIFAYEPRNQGESEALPKYSPLHWVTGYEVMDARAAMNYVASRPETIKMGGFGVFGISRGGSALLFLSGDNPQVQCIVTDGIYPTYSLMLPYIRQWISIYVKENSWAHDYLPDSVCGWFALGALKQVENEYKIQIPYLENEMGKLKKKPFLMIHGAEDRYIKPEVAKKMFDISNGGKRAPVPVHHEFWLIDKAKHNEGIQREPELYPTRVRGFFDRYLAHAESQTNPVLASQAIQAPASQIPPKAAANQAVTPQTNQAPTPQVNQVVESVQGPKLSGPRDKHAFTTP